MLIRDSTAASVAEASGTTLGEVESVSIYAGSIIVDVCFKSTAGLILDDLVGVADNITLGSTPQFEINVTSDTGDEIILTPTRVVVVTTCSASPTAAPSPAPTFAPTLPQCTVADAFVCADFDATVDCDDANQQGLCPGICGVCDVSSNVYTTTPAPTTETVILTRGSGNDEDSDSLWWLGFVVAAVLLCCLLFCVLLLCCCKSEDFKDSLSSVDDDEASLTRRISDELLMDDEELPTAGKTSLDCDVPPTTKADDSDTLWDHYEMEHALYRASQAGTARRPSEGSLGDDATEHGGPATEFSDVHSDAQEPTGFFDTPLNVAEVSRRLSASRLTAMASSDGSFDGTESEESLMSSRGSVGLRTLMEPRAPPSPAGVQRASSDTSTLTQRRSSGAAMVMRYFSSSHADDADAFTTDLEAELHISGMAFDTDSENPTPQVTPLSTPQSTRVPTPVTAVTPPNNRRIGLAGHSKTTSTV